MPRFGDSNSANAYHRKVAAAKAAQRVPYAVAPSQRLVTSRKAFEAGQEVRPEDLDTPAGTPPLTAMRQLVDAGLVIEWDSPVRNVKDPIGVVAGREGLATGHGILAPGDAIAKGDFDPSTLKRLVEAGRVVLT